MGCRVRSMTVSSMDACCKFTMTQLLSSQKKSLRWCLGNIHPEPSRSACIPEAALRGFCEVLFQDQKWAEIWTVEDVGNVLWQLLHGRSELLTGVVGSLSEIENVELLDQLCREAIQELESYPRQYNIYIELPGLYWEGATITELILTDSMTLLGTAKPSVATSALIRPDRPLGDTSCASTVEEFMEAIAPVAAILLRRETIYLQILEKGFLNPLRLNEMPVMLSAALLKLKVLLVFAMEIGLLERREVYRLEYPTDGDWGEPVHVACHEATDSGKACLGLPNDMGNFLRGITFTTLKQVTISGIKGLLTPILEFIETLDSDEHAVGIGAGIEGLLDSLVSSNQTVSLLQCCIGIESILGEKNSGMQELGTTARLAERYSYLMGDSVPDRIRLREDFRKIFLKRGELVHARKTRLSLRDNWIVPKAQEMLQRLIRKELSLHLGIDAGRLVKMQLEHLRMDYSVSRWR